MNRRIQELAAQYAKNHDYPYWNEDHVEKFTELIVFECIKIAVFKGDLATGRAIKEYFGVE